MVVTIYSTMIVCLSTILILLLLLLAVIDAEILLLFFYIYANPIPKQALMIRIGKLR